MIDNITVLKIDNVEVFLNEMGPNQGKIIISDNYNHNYSYYWGAMGGSLHNFIKAIDADYFAKNLIGNGNNFVLDPKKTLATIRKYIQTEMGLPWYTHMEFQKELREKLNELQNYIEDDSSDHNFVYGFENFINQLDFSSINDEYDRKQIEKDFKNIDEPWDFIERKYSNNYQWLMKFHSKLKKQLK